MKNLNTINTVSSQSAETILSALSPEARAAIGQYYEGKVRSDIAQQISGASSLVAAPQKPAVRKTPNASEPVAHGRQHTPNGLSASEWIRQFDASHPGTPANDVVAEGAKVGLNIAAALVYNVRQNVKKAKDKAVATPATPAPVAAPVDVPVTVETVATPAPAPVAVSDEEAARKAKQNANLEKARAARAANQAAKLAAANTTTSNAVEAAKAPKAGKKVAPAPVAE